MLYSVVDILRHNEFHSFGVVSMTGVGIFLVKYKYTSLILTQTKPILTDR